MGVGGLPSSLPAKTGLWIEDSSPAIGSNGTIYVGSWDDNLYAINPDGTLKWSYAIGSNIDSSPAKGSGGTIYVGSYYYSESFHFQQVTILSTD